MATLSVSRPVTVKWSLRPLRTESRRASLSVPPCWPRWGEERVCCLISLGKCELRKKSKCNRESCRIFHPRPIYLLYVLSLGSEKAQLWGTQEREGKTWKGLLRGTTVSQVTLAACELMWPACCRSHVWLINWCVELEIPHSGWETFFVPLSFLFWTWVKTITFWPLLHPPEILCLPYSVFSDEYLRDYLINEDGQTHTLGNSGRNRKWILDV